MTNIASKIDNILKNKDLSRYKLSKLIKSSEGAFNQMARGDRAFSEKIIQKILPIIEISREEFESWIVADKYPKEIIERAIQIKKEWPYKRKSVFTAKIDKILEEKGMSRTALAKQIIYPQSTLNTIITGKRGMPESVLEKIAEALDISQEEILSWILTDKYSLEILELAYSCKL